MDHTTKQPLPPIREDKILNLPHFPTPMQALVFRLWDMVPAKRIAKVIKTTEENVYAMATQMGLPPQNCSDEFLQKGYISIIRAVWHLLPYEQLLQLLGWSADKLAFVLKEDDFLSVKLGNYKHGCKEIVYCQLTDVELKKTEKIKSAMEKYIRIYDKLEMSQPFDLFCRTKQTTQSSKTRGSEYDVEITNSWYIVDCAKTENSSYFINQFVQDCTELWDVTLKTAQQTTGFCIVAQIKKENEQEDDEYHTIDITPTKITIIANGEVGILRGLNFLEKTAKKAGGLFYKTGVHKRKPNFETRYIYSYCGLYGNAFDVDTEISYPSDLLKAYSKLDINGIWLQAVLYQMTEFPFEPSISQGWGERLNRLKELVLRAKKYGIKVYLYINEPRSMPIDFFKKYPDLQGYIADDFACMCTSTADVLRYLSNSITAICKTVPNLGGFFTITRSENLTNCYSHTTQAGQTCPRCKMRCTSDVVAEVIATVANAASGVNPNIKTFAWTWQWVDDGFATEQEAIDCIAKLPENVIVQCVSENKLAYCIGGIEGDVVDYSMSLVGPSELSKHLWKAAKDTNHQTAAKVQINNTWECSTVPYIPVYELIIQHMQGLIKVGVNHLMLSWTLGGYPSENLKIVSSMFFECEGDFYNQALMAAYPKYYKEIKVAVEAFCEAFSEFPFHFNTLYCGPQNGGVANILFEKSTELNATMTCYAYDDLTAWRSVYPIDVFENQFKLLSEKWGSGMELLKYVPTCEFADIATACYAIFSSSYNQICFVRLRDEFLKTNSDLIRKQLLEILKKELSLATEFYTIMLRNPTIGFEAANHYYYTLSSIMEKIVCCDYLMERYKTK